jgi:two-component system, sensor histidine kinase and response regulator
MILSTMAPKITVVDDEVANLRLMDELLRQKGYQVRCFPRGRLALAAAAEDPPDLILLDVNMPELNGYEVCAQLKSDDSLAAIPVIFLSALHETDDKVLGFRSGGVDYISKPFQFEEVYARVETHLKVHTLQRELRLQNEHLEEIVSERTRELAEAHAQLATLDRAKDDFLRIISHELRTPLNGVLGIGEIVLDQLAPSAENTELLAMFEQSRRRILLLLDDALVLTQIGGKSRSVQMTPVSLSLVLDRAIEGAAKSAQARNIELQPPSAGPGQVRGEEQLLARALYALLETAVSLSGEGSAVRVSREVVEGVETVAIDTDGKTIPVHLIPKFFDICSLHEGIIPGYDIGLGPAVACRVLSALSSRVRISNREPSGIRLTVSFSAA